jgi:GNAT superfamily N-acetyltransferase
MLSSFWVVSTKPETALGRRPGWRPWQGRGWALAPCDRGPEAGLYCWEGHYPGVNIGIRDARPGDSPAIARLLDQLGYPSSAEQVLRRLERLRRSGSDRVFVAELGAEVVGLASLHVSRSLESDGDAGKVSAIVVDERHRRRGIGEALMDAVEVEARARGCILLYLTTAERRKDAHAFYQRIGLEETGRRFAKQL